MTQQKSQYADRVLAFLLLRFFIRKHERLDSLEKSQSSLIIIKTVSLAPIGGFDDLVTRLIVERLPYHF